MWNVLALELASPDWAADAASGAPQFAHDVAADSVDFGDSVDSAEFAESADFAGAENAENVENSVDSANYCGEAPRRPAHVAAGYAFAPSG